jgi:anti-anti-sigma regulatory factor
LRHFGCGDTLNERREEFIPFTDSRSSHPEAATMLDLASGWNLHVDYSSEWLFFRLESLGSENVSPALSKSLWSVAQKNQIHCLVCELAESVWMNSYLVGQLLILHKRAHLEGGTLRLCELSAENYSVVRSMGFGERFPNYTSREDAVMGHRPRKPR